MILMILKLITNNFLLLQIFLPSNWFFGKASDVKDTKESFHRRRTVSEPSEAACDENKEETENQSLTNLISRQFSATTELQIFNYSIPQSQ